MTAHANGAKAGYKVRCAISLFGYRPQDVKASDGFVAAKLSSEPLGVSSWLEPPHVALANILTRDAEQNVRMTPEPGLILDDAAVEKFVRKYGFLHSKLSRESLMDGERDETETSQESIAEIASIQETLRKAWHPFLVAGRPLRVETASLDGFEMKVEENGDLTIWTDDLENFIGALFAIDDKAGKLSICGNPGCIAPYFLKKRTTQKFCELGACTAYAARQYTKHWWDSGGREARVRKRKRKKRSK